jgi:hypothetical protein
MLNEETYFVLSEKLNEIRRGGLSKYEDNDLE